MHHIVAVLGRALGSQPLQLRQRNIEIVKRAKSRGARPRLGGRSAQRVHDQADGNMNLVLDLASEVIPDR